MWLRRWIALVFFFYIQAVIVAHALDQLEDDPLLDIAWLAVFGPLITYFAIAGLLLVIGWIQLGYRYFLGRVRPADQFSDRTVLGEDEELQRQIRIEFGDLIADTALFLPLVTFFALMLDQLERLDDAEDLRNWILVLLPLAVFGVVLAVILLLGAIRTCAEERMQQGDLPVNLCCAAAFNDVVVGCALDSETLEQARARRHDKTDTYLADSDYHTIPCTYLCARDLTTNFAEFLLNWVLFIAVVVGAVDVLLLGVHLEVGHPSLFFIFLLLWFVELALVVLSVLMFVVLCNDARATGREAPPRYSLMQKYHTVLIVFITSLLLMLFKVLLLWKILSDTDESWHIVFLPLYVLFGVGLIIACCYSSITAVERDANSKLYTRATNAASGAKSTAQSAARFKVAQNDVARKKQARATSGYGLL